MEYMRADKFLPFSFFVTSTGMASCRVDRLLHSNCCKPYHKFIFVHHNLTSPSSTCTGSLIPDQFSPCTKMGNETLLQVCMSVWWGVCVICRFHNRSAWLASKQHCQQLHKPVSAWSLLCWVSVLPPLVSPLE